MADNEGLESINSLNSIPRDVFNFFHNWTKEYATHKRRHCYTNSCIPSGSGGTGKSSLVKMIY